MFQENLHHKRYLFAFTADYRSFINHRGRGYISLLFDFVKV